MRDWRAEAGGEARVSSLRVRNAVRHDRTPEEEDAIAAGEIVVSVDSMCLGQLAAPGPLGADIRVVIPIFFSVSPNFTARHIHENLNYGHFFLMGSIIIIFFFFKIVLLRSSFLRSSGGQ